MIPGIPVTYQNLPESDSGSFQYARSCDYLFTYWHELLCPGRRSKTPL